MVSFVLADRSNEWKRGEKRRNSRLLASCSLSLSLNFFVFHFSLYDVAGRCLCFDAHVRSLFHFELANSSSSSFPPIAGHLWRQKYSVVEEHTVHGIYHTNADAMRQLALMYHEKLLLRFFVFFIILGRSYNLEANWPKATARVFDSVLLLPFIQSFST